MRAANSMFSGPDGSHIPHAYAQHRRAAGEAEFSLGLKMGKNKKGKIKKLIFMKLNFKNFSTNDYRWLLYGRLWDVHAKFPFFFVYFFKFENYFPKFQFYKTLSSVQKCINSTNFVKNIYIKKVFFHFLTHK